MGFLDDLGKVVGAVTGQAARPQAAPNLGGANAQLVQAVLGMLANGGLQNVLGTLQQKGLGNVAGSWISTGQNLPVNPNDLANALGPDKIGALAKAAGLDTGAVAGQLSKVLPGLVDHLTPKGNVPDNSALELGLSALKKLL